MATPSDSSKRSRSTELTGGEGFTYEDTIVAYYLTALLHEDNAAGISGNVSRVAVQQASQGEPLDDLVIDALLKDEPRRLSLQVKRDLTISAAASNSDFLELVANCRKTRAKPDFRVGVDRYGFIARRVGDERLNALQKFIRWAQASPTGADFAARFEPGGEASQADIAQRNELQPLISARADEEADIYRHFVALRMDGFDLTGDRFADMTNRLGYLTAAGMQDGPALAEALCRHVRIGEGAAKIWTRSSLLAELRLLIPLKVAPSYAADVTALLELAKTSVHEIRTDIGGFALDRGSFGDKAQDVSANARLTNISGLPGSGKSAVLRQLVVRAIARGPTLFLKSDRIGAISWRAFATNLGVQHCAPQDLLAEIGAAGTAILFIDGIDRIKPAQRQVIIDLFHAIETTPSLAHWKVIATSRNQGLEAFRQWVPASFYKSTGIGDVPVEILSDEEAEVLANEKPQLRRLLFAGQAVQEIARRPFFAAVLADQFAGQDAGTASPPQTETELIDAWWQAGGHNAAEDAIFARQRAIIDLAEAGAPSLGKAIPARALTQGTIGVAPELKRDHIIEVVEAGSVLSFAHDIFFEWAFFRLLIDKGTAWLDPIVAAGEPPLLARAIGLLSQRVFETGGGWADAFNALQGSRLRPQWRRAWLLGPPESTKFLQSLKAYETPLFADNAALLIKFLVWFQAERTIPNPLLLNNPHAAITGAALVRAADQWGWPSDLSLWRRVLSWLIARQAILPATATPHVLQVFSVFQNMLGDLPNPTSEKLIALVETWLNEIEAAAADTDTPHQSTPRQTLPRRGGERVASTIRQLILRSGRAYPQPARRIVERAIALEKRPHGLFDAIVSFSPILAQVCPEQLAELLCVEIFEELPLDELTKERRRREAHYQRLAAVRAKPESERSENESRFLKHSFPLFGDKTYDFDDIGIDARHQFFYPPTPLHQPFASLFALAPAVALTLVRDIGNRATTGWKQIHEINSPRFGTPLPLDVSLPWGQQRFWGDARTYGWYLGEVGPQPLEAAFLALTYWAHKRLDAGEDVDAILRDVVEGHENWTVLGLAASLALERIHLSYTTLALVCTQRLWQQDMARQVQSRGRHITIFGLNPRDRMSTDQTDAFDYLEKRQFRDRSIRDMTANFALSNNAAWKTRLKTDLRRFPKELPFTCEEERDDGAARSHLLEMAKIWATWGDPANYNVQPVADKPNAVAVTFNPPEPPAEAFEAARQENAKAMADISVLHWAHKSLKQDALDLTYQLPAVVDFVRTRDSTTLFEQLADAGESTTQSSVAAAAAVAACFSQDAAAVSWAWSILDRVLSMNDEKDPLHFGKHSFDPRLYLIAALSRDLRKEAKRPDTVKNLFRLASDANHHIAQNATAVLLRCADPRTVWIAAAMATELFCVHAADVDDDGKRSREAQETQRLATRAQALTRLDESTMPPLARLPEAWIEAPRRRHGSWDSSPIVNEWRHPDFDFYPDQAAELTLEFPVEALCASPTHRDAFLDYLDQLVRWTKDRLYPQWQSEKKRDRQSTDLIGWLNALSDLVARTVPVLPVGEAIARFIDPIGAARNDDGIRFIADLTRNVVCRHVYDAPRMTDHTFGILQHCLHRLLQEREFDRSSYRAGEVHGSDVPRMIEALLLISVKNASGAARFANGNWTDLGQLLPIIDAMMQGAGWSPFVMSTYLTLCERGGAALPIDAFLRHIMPHIEGEAPAANDWIDAALTARIAGVVQTLAEANYPLSRDHARGLLRILDRLVDLGDRRAAALQLSEYFRGVQLN